MASVLLFVQSSNNNFARFQSIIAEFGINIEQNEGELYDLSFKSDTVKSNALKKLKNSGVSYNIRKDNVTAKYSYFPQMSEIMFVTDEIKMAQTNDIDPLQFFPSGRPQVDSSGFNKYFHVSDSPLQESDKLKSKSKFKTPDQTDKKDIQRQDPKGNMNDKSPK